MEQPRSQVSTMKLRNSIGVVTVGSWGRDPGQLSLKAARNEWTQLKAWALAEGKDPRDKRRNEKVGLHLQQQTGFDADVLPL